MKHQEEIDWYCCNIGAFHVTRAMDPSLRVAEQDDIKRWVLVEDRVLVRAVAKAVGADELVQLVAHFTGRQEPLKAAKVRNSYTHNDACCPLPLICDAFLLGDPNNTG